LHKLLLNLSISRGLGCRADLVEVHNEEAHRTFTEAEVSTHNKRSDLWIILKNKVYDVTPFVEEHPGGDAILNNAGGDSTVGFFGYFLCTLNSRL
jgi:cytochrome b involved in lipid metabolism